MEVFLRPIGHQSDVVSLDAPDDATIEDVIALVADEHNLLPESVRLVFNGRVVQKSVCVSTLASSAANPITFYGRPQPKAPEPAPPPPAASPAASPASPGAADPAVARLTDMGFDAALCERALALTSGDANTAVELLVTGKVSPEGLQELIQSRPVDDAAILEQILANPSLIERALRGEDLVVSIIGGGQDGQCVVRNTELEDYVRATYGMDMRSFVQGGGTQRAAARRVIESEQLQPLLDRKWLEKYATFPPQEKVKVEALKELTSDVALIVQVLVGCGGNVGDARAVLEQLRQVG
jgi:ribosomal protein S9